MGGTKKVFRKKIKRKNTTAKIYAIDRYKYYNFHKITAMSFNPVKSCECIQNLLGKNNVSKIQTPPDPWIKARGAKWVRCLNGGKAEFHFLPPYHLKYGKMLRQISKEQDNNIPYSSQFFENHIGIYVPDLTNVCIRAKKYKYKFYLTRRSDGLNQLYVSVPHGIDFIEIDSVKIDLAKLLKYGIPQHDFNHTLKLGKMLEKTYKQTKKHNKNQNTKKYFDPKHFDAPRFVTKINNTLTITGRDGPGKKLWKIKGIIKNNTSTLDFSSKGGPKKITATFLKNTIKFSDGNVWTTISK